MNENTIDEFTGYQCAICWNVYREYKILSKHQSPTHHGGYRRVQVKVIVIAD